MNAEVPISPAARIRRHRFRSVVATAGGDPIGSGAFHRRRGGGTTAKGVIRFRRTWFFRRASMSLEAGTVECITAWATVGLAAGTLVLALVAIFPDTVRRWFYRPNLEVSIQTQPPDCVAVPITITRPAGQTDVNSFYLRLWVKNTGNTTAKTVEVYAEELLRRFNWPRAAPE